MVSRPPCALCKLPVPIPPITQTFDGAEQMFCCQGCARVYQAAWENGLLEQVSGLSRPPKPRRIPPIGGTSARFAIEGMWCAGCALAAENILKSIPGVQAADISFAAELGRIEFDPNAVDPAQALRTLDKLGYHVRVAADQGATDATRHQEHLLLQLLTAAAFGMQVMLLYLTQLYHFYAVGEFDLPMVRELQYLAWAMTTPALFYGGSSFLRGAWRALRARTATMDTLVTLGTLSAYSYSVYVTLSGRAEVYFDSVAMIITFVMLGRWLETLGSGQARKGIRKLLAAQPQQAWQRQGADWVQVPAATLQVGEEILVKAGERAPLDAGIIEGEAALDESLLTGEAAPVECKPGDIIFAGTVVTDAPLICRVTRAADQTRLAQITHLVEQTLTAKPPLQRLADRVSAWFTLAILLAALLTASGWYLAGSSLSHALLNAVAVLVVACPCALGLATPLAVAVSLGQAAEQGVLVRNPDALERGGQIRRAVFDKTGTLTRGKLSVAAVETMPGRGPNATTVLGLVASVEQRSGHPLAKAIQSAAAEAAAPRPAAADFKTLRGLGVSAQVQGRRLLVGNERLFAGAATPALQNCAAAHAARGETIIWAGWDAAPFAFLALRDTLNPDAPAALQALRAQGVEVAMLSGDGTDTVRAVAAELEMDEYAAHCLPEEKTARLRGWQAAGEPVLMAGDGINDAPALAQADLSITVAGGTDIAGETSDLLLMRPALLLIPWFLDLARRTRRIIYENLGWAFAYNLIVIPLAALGRISPAIAALAMSGSSLLVVLNSLRLRR